MLFLAHLARASALLASATAFLGWTAAAEDSSLSSFLKAKYSVSQGDYLQAAEHYEEAIKSDPGNVELLLPAHLVFIVAGEFDQVVATAESLSRNDVSGLFVSLSLLIDEVHAGDYEAALEIHESAGFENLFLGDLLLGWLHLGAGDPDAALELFGKEMEGQFLANVLNFHRGLAQSSLGDLESAAETFAALELIPEAFPDEYHIRHADILARLGDVDSAERLLTEGLGKASEIGREVIAAKLKDLDALGGSAGGRSYAPEDGIAEALLMFARLLASEDGSGFIQPALFLRFAEMAGPDDSTAKFHVAAFLAEAEVYALAADVFKGIAAGDPLRLSAEIGRVEALHDSGHVEQAVAALEALASEFPDSERVPAALGNILREESRFEEAIEAYNDALAILPDRSSGNMLTYYFRGISLERAGRWEEAKADLNVARELSEGLPAHPYVMNYLGYSMLIEGEDAAEAEAIIRVAVEAEPENGAFVDSLGWALYLLGRYDEALVELEKALKLEPTEPEIIEHLGDAYWQVGRRREAEFQWRRALSFNPKEEFRTRIERKLEVGLDEALAESADSPDEPPAN